MTKPALLDVNVLIALFDPTHVHHEPAHDWFADNRSRGWATCPLTENAFVRILSRPLPGRPVERPAILAGHLRALCGAADHLFWPDTISLLDPDRFELSGAPQRELTDIYLAALASAHGGVLATFDASIFVAAAPGADLEVIGAG
ncbi:MAG TPA: TA system VapC family ribonuclease toxin [Vicinamibacterales bacterium]